jgi:hypothetical protein
LAEQVVLFTVMVFLRYEIWFFLIFRSAVLEDIYRRYEHLTDDEEDEYDQRDRHGVDRDEDYDADVSF